MDKITLEFIPTRKIPWVGLLFLLLSLGVTGFMLSEWVKLRRENQQLSENVERLETALRKKKAEIAAERQKRDEISAAALKTYAPVLKSLNYPWNQVFSEVEDASSKDVALLSFAHDQTTTVTHLTVEVLEFPAMSQFVQRLNSAETSRWYIASYHLQSQNSPATMQGEITQK